MSQLTMQLRIDASGGNVPTIVREDCAKAASRIEDLERLLLSIRIYMVPGNVMAVPEQAKYIAQWIDERFPVDGGADVP